MHTWNVRLVHVSRGASTEVNIDADTETAAREHAQQVAPGFAIQSATDIGPTQPAAT